MPESVAGPDAGDRARTLLVLDAVPSDRISWREGARILNLPPSQFLDLAARHAVPVTRVSEADLDADLATLDGLMSGR